MFGVNCLFVFFMALLLNIRKNEEGRDVFPVLLFFVNRKKSSVTKITSSCMMKQNMEEIMYFVAILSLVICPFVAFAANSSEVDPMEHLPEISVVSSDSSVGNAENSVSESVTMQTHVDELEIVDYNVFTPRFMKNLRLCQTDEEKNESSLLKIMESNQGKCHLRYNTYDLFVPHEILTNIHGFDDIKALLKNKDITQYNYHPQYVYKGLLYALNACQNGKTYTVPMEIYTHDEITETTGLFAEIKQKICIITLYNAMTIDENVTDYSVTCRITNDVLENVLAHYTDLLKKYGAKRYVQHGKIQTQSEQHNTKTELADKEILFYLQNKNHCQKPNIP